MPRPPRAWPFLAGGALLLGLGLGRMALTDPDEARYAAAAREMITTGDPIVPRFNGAPRLDKPPLIYWLQAGAFRLLGTGEAAARLPSLLAAIATLGLTTWWARRRLGPGAGAPAAAALATCLIFFACARLAITDMLLALWVTATLLLWHEAVLETQRPARRRLAMAAAAACGLAFLAKGPVGVVLPALVMLAVAASSGRSGRITASGVLMGAAGVALVAGPWAAGLVARVGAGGVLEILRREAYERAVWGLDHPRPFHYLLVSFWATFLPWSLAAPFVLFRAARASRRGRTAAPLPLIWFATVIIFFSLLADKNDAYLLPAAPALALLVTAFLPRRLVLASAGAAAALLLAAALLAAPRLSERRSLKQAALQAGLAGRGDYTLLSYRIYRPSLVFYAGRRARWISSGAELAELLET
ncbi:MAG: ArnT family glycosyltransferase, partial [Planctomycetota bacterium]